jgi:hypothetical protein
MNNLFLSYDLMAHRDKRVRFSSTMEGPVIYFWKDPDYDDHYWDEPFYYDRVATIEYGEARLHILCLTEDDCNTIRDHIVRGEPGRMHSDDEITVTINADRSVTVEASAAIRLTLPSLRLRAEPPPEGQ